MKLKPYVAYVDNSITPSGDSPTAGFGTRWVMAKRIRVALVDDYSIVLAGLQALLAPHRDKILVVEATIDTTPHRDVDVTLFDTFGERTSYETRVRELAADADAGAVIVFSFSDEPLLIRRLIRAGAHGFISKTAPPDLIVEGILAAAHREPVMITQRSQRATIQPPITWPGRNDGLTVRESEILALLPTGMTNSEIAAHLHVSVNTVKTQLRGLFSKLEVRNRVEAVAAALSGMLGEHGLQA
jgi:DNA-binding NarL/FixJ family response regulator